MCYNLYRSHRLEPSNLYDSGGGEDSHVVNRQGGRKRTQFLWHACTFVWLTRRFRESTVAQSCACGKLKFINRFCFRHYELCINLPNCSVEFGARFVLENVIFVFLQHRPRGTRLQKSTCYWFLSAKDSGSSFSCEAMNYLAVTPVSPGSRAV